MQQFHNNGIKRQVISEAVQRVRKMIGSRKKLRLMDLCCGKGGDIPNGDAGIDYVLGVEKVVDNLYNPKDGACIRYLNYLDTAQKLQVICQKLNLY